MAALQPRKKRTLTEQFHLSRLQVINWGVFDGYHSIPFSSGGALIAGASGSGKSSLLDAISLGFLPFNRRNFNASGDNTAAGSSAGRRTVDKYVRGAQALQAFRKFGFQLVIVATVQNATTIQPYID